MKTSVVLLVGVLMVVIGIGVWYFFFREGEESTQPSPKPLPSPSVSPPLPSPSVSPPLPSPSVSPSPTPFQSPVTVPSSPVGTGFRTDFVIDYSGSTPGVNATTSASDQRTFGLYFAQGGLATNKLTVIQIVSGKYIKLNETQIMYVTYVHSSNIVFFGYLVDPSTGLKIDDVPTASDITMAVIGDLIL